MIVVFEGIDFSGKTTLIEELDKTTDIEICHHLKPSTIFKDELEHHNLIDFKAHTEYQIINQLHKFINKTIVFDRFIISNIAYLKLYKRKYDISYLNSEHWEDLRIIYVNIERETLVKRMGRGDFLDLDVNKLMSLRDEYEKALIEFNHSYLRINTEDLFQENITKIKHYIGI